MKFLRKKIIFFFQLVFVCLFFACSSERFVPVNSHLYESARIVSSEEKFKTSQYYSYIRKHPNTKWFGYFKIPMGPFLLQSSDSVSKFNKFLKRIGEAPSILDTLSLSFTKNDISQSVNNNGYLQNKVDIKQIFKSYKCNVEYQIKPGPIYYIHDYTVTCEDSLLSDYLRKNILFNRSFVGQPFSLEILSDERSRIQTFLVNNGYFDFNKSYLHFYADTTQMSHIVMLNCNIEKMQNGRMHTRYIVDSIRFNPLIEQRFRKRLLRNMSFIQSGNYYSASDVINAHNSFSRLGNVTGSSINFLKTDSAQLEANVNLSLAKTHSFQFNPEGTNTAGDIGAAISVSYINRNLFKGGETFTTKFRVAYETIKQIEGYSAQNFFEYSIETNLRFPSFRFPFVSNRFRSRSLAETEFSIMYDSQNRPEFYRRVLTGSWRYRWYKRNHRLEHRVDLLNVNYIFLPWISDTFKRDYLSDSSNRNAILRYNYENLFIMRAGYTFLYKSNQSELNPYSIRASFEMAGNLLRMFSAITNNKVHSDGYLHFLNIPYAQYIKGEFDYSKTFRLDDKNSLAFHSFFGIAYPYGNSRVLPYEKRYFSGGANSVRGWSVRGLGPGRFRGYDGRIDFINQTGDIKLDLSLEYRAKLFWKVNGALFVDAGNIWTIRKYDEQPGGNFSFDSFYKQIAVSYGLGFRLDFNYFIIRFDGAMKAINPAYESNKKYFAIVNPNFSRDFTFHFAVGLPF